MLRIMAGLILAIFGVVFAAILIMGDTVAHAAEYDTDF